MLKDEKQFVFIIGAPRSGTTWLHHILAAHPEIASVEPELTVFSRYIPSLVKNYEEEDLHIKKGDWVQGLPYLWNRDIFDGHITEFIDAIYSTLAVQPQHKIILDKQPNYSFHINLIHRYLPNAKFIHIIRDGREVASSWHRVWHEQGFGNSSFAGACLDWIRYKDAARKAKEYTEKQYREIRYEALLNDTEQILKQLFLFCEIAADTQTIKTITYAHTGEKSLLSAPDKKTSYIEKKSGQTWKKTLSKEQLYIAKKYLGRELIKEGYEQNESWGLSKLYMAFFIIKSLPKRIFNKLFK